MVPLTRLDIALGSPTGISKSHLFSFVKSKPNLEKLEKRRGQSAAEDDSEDGDEGGCRQKDLANPI